MPPTPLHASCVAIGGGAVLLLGKAGAGKTTLALQLMAYGGILVADDQVCLEARPEGLCATCHPNVQGLIEARGVGVLMANSQDSAIVHLVINLDITEKERIPPRREVTIMGQTLPLLHRVDSIHFAPAVLQWMRAGRSER